MIKPFSSVKCFLKKLLILSSLIIPLELFNIIAYIPNNIICIPVKSSAFAKMAVDNPRGISNTTIGLEKRIIVKKSPKRKIINPGTRKRYFGEKISMKRRWRHPSLKEWRCVILFCEARQ